MTLSPGSVAPNRLLTRRFIESSGRLPRIIHPNRLFWNARRRVVVAPFVPGGILATCLATSRTRGDTLSYDRDTFESSGNFRRGKSCRKSLVSSRKRSGSGSRSRLREWPRWMSTFRDGGFETMASSGVQPFESRSRAFRYRYRLGWGFSPDRKG